MLIVWTHTGLFFRPFHDCFDYIKFLQMNIDNWKETNVYSIVFLFLLINCAYAFSL